MRIQIITYLNCIRDKHFIHFAFYLDKLISTVRNIKGIKMWRRLCIFLFCAFGMFLTRFFIVLQICFETVFKNGLLFFYQI